jgi:hypothetical protein
MAKHKLLYFKRHGALVALDSPLYTMFCREAYESIKSRIGIFDWIRVLHYYYQESYFFPSYLKKQGMKSSYIFDKDRMVGTVNPPAPNWEDMKNSRLSHTLY